MNDDSPVRVTDAARHLGIHRETIYVAIKKGYIPTYKIEGHACPRVYIKDVAEWNEKRTKKESKLKPAEKIVRHIPDSIPCIRCNGDRWVYEKWGNHYFACPSCNADSPYTKQNLRAANRDSDSEVCV